MQRWLSGVRLPALGEPGPGPAWHSRRALLTVSAVLLGVATVAYATGLSATMVSYGDAVEGADRAQVIVWAKGQPFAGFRPAARRRRDTDAAAPTAARGGRVRRGLRPRAAARAEPGRGDRGRSRGPVGSSRRTWPGAAGCGGPGEVVASGRFLAEVADLRLAAPRPGCGERPTGTRDPGRGGHVRAVGLDARGLGDRNRPDTGRAGRPGLVDRRIRCRRLMKAVAVNQARRTRRPR